MAMSFTGNELYWVLRHEPFMHQILQDAGANFYDCGVTTQMRIYAYDYITKILAEAQAASASAGKETVDVEDIRQAKKTLKEKTTLKAPPPELRPGYAEKVNAQPLPTIKPKPYGLRVPPFDPPKRTFGRMYMPTLASTSQSSGGSQPAKKDAANGKVGGASTSKAATAGMTNSPSTSKAATAGMTNSPSTSKAATAGMTNSPSTSGTKRKFSKN